MDLRSFSIETDRLVLRSVQASDSEVLRGLMTPDISRWVAAWPFPLDIATVDALLEKAIGGAASGSVLPMVIIERTCGQLIGWIKLECVEQSGERGAELGYWVAEKAQGKGYAFEAATAAIQAAFEILSVAYIEAGAQPANAISHHLLQKLGMRSIGERQVWSPARNRHGVCLFWRVDKGHDLIAVGFRGVSATS